MPSILIVDDEPHLRMLLEQTLEDLEDEGIEILKAENGEVAVSMIAEYKPEIVFLDVMMPKMNGFEVCAHVRNVLGMSDIYIVMLTAKGQEFDKQKGMSAGANIYMTKPFDPDEIISLAHRVLGI